MITSRKNVPVRASLIPCALLLMSLPAVSAAQQVGMIEHVAANSVEVNIITPGPDGALWFTDGPSIGRMTTAGAFSQYPIPGLTFGGGITAGPDGALWFTEQAGEIGRITTDGAVSDFLLPPNQAGSFITAGPDGALWFTEVGANSIGRITTTGEVTSYPVPTLSSAPQGITTGPDGALWFTEQDVDKIGRITTSGTITEYPITSGTLPLAIVTGPDGALWFTGQGNQKIGRITTAGAFKEFPTVAQASLFQITAGSDGALWFGDSGNSAIGKITTSGKVTEYPTPTKVMQTFGITGGPDGAIWFTEFVNENVQKIGQAVFETAALSLTPNVGQPGREIVLSGGGFAPNEQVNLYANSTSANLINTAVANGSGGFMISGSAHTGPYGPNSLTGVGQTSGKLGVAAFSTEARITISPETATPGTTITVDGFGFAANGDAFMEFGPAGDTSFLGLALTNSEGTFAQAGAFTFTIPVGTLPGQYQVEALSGQEGGGDNARATLTVQ